VLDHLVATSLRHRQLILVLAALFFVYGIWSVRDAKLDVLPDFAPPQAVVQTEAPGFAPEQVEQLVTRPIETALGGVAGLESIRSESIQGLSVVTVVFAEGADVFRARQLLAESLADAAPRLPIGVSPPRVSPLTSATMDVLKIGLQSSVLTPMELRSLADWTVRPRLMMVPGVARVNVFGGDVRQIRIEASSEGLLARGIAFSDLVAAARAATSVPGAGFIDTPNQRIVIEASNLGPDVDAIGDVVVTRTPNSVVRLRDVARVIEAPAPAFGDALIRGEPGVLLTLSATYGSNTLDVTRRIEAALADLRPTFDREQITLHPDLHRPADFIETSLRNLQWTLVAGTLLVILVLTAILRDARAVAVSLVAIPMSLLSAVLVSSRLGMTLDTMSLGGLAIAIGEVVDDAIVDVENIQRRLRENESAGRPRSAASVVLSASIEVRGAVVFATLAVALIFVPLLSLRGIQGRFFAPLATTYLLAVFASLLTALTLTPAMALTFFDRRPPKAEFPRIQQQVRARYRSALTWVHGRVRMTLVPAALLACAALASIPFLGGEFVPAFRENHLVLQAATLPGTSLGEMRRIGTDLSVRILRLPGVRTIEQQIGRAESGEDTWGTNRSEFHLELVPGSDRDVTQDEIRRILDATPGVNFEILSFLGDRISETISGETASVVVSLFSEDLAVLDAKADEIEKVIGAVPGAVDVTVGDRALGPHAVVGLRADRLRMYGFLAGDVLEQIHTAFAGSTVGQVNRGNQPIDVAVALGVGERQSPDLIDSLLVSDGKGSAIRLGALASVEIVSGRDNILHEGGRRRQTITCNVKGRDVVGFSREARDRIVAQVVLPSGAYFVMGGEAEARGAAIRDLAAKAIAGMTGVLVLLWVATGHLRNVAIIAAMTPLAASGGVLAVLIHALVTRSPAILSLGSLVGFVTLFGIATRHSIMMVSHYRHLVRVDGLAWNRETALTGATDRVVPILITTLVTALALLPVALRAGEAGEEIDGPLAIVILGGLAMSSASTLLLLPGLALRFGRFDREPES
jgi:CzcA family heavy metal efflux pump